MQKHLTLYVKYKASFPEESDTTILSIVEKELSEKSPILRRGVELGVSLVRGVGSGTHEARVRRAIALETALREKTRVTNNSLAVSRGDLCEYDNPVKTAGTPYEFERIRTKKEDIPALLRAQANAVKHGGNQTFTEK